MLLIWGPPGAGKSHVVMSDIRRLLASGARDFRLLVPTATMAEHLRNQLAREGFAFAPELVSTLTRFLAGFSSGLQQAPAAALPLMIEAVLERSAPAAFAKVASFPGFATSLARLIEDFTSAGCNADRLSNLVDRFDIGGPIVAGFIEVWREAKAEMRQRGWLLRGEMLRVQASRIRSGGVPGVGRIFFDGFLSLTDPELEVVGALASQTDVTVTLPAWTGADAARKTLREIAFREDLLSEVRRVRPREAVIEARSLAEETGEVARRILDEHRRGRSWREIGVIVRRAGSYVPALRTSFERFGIPARFYFAGAAAEHEAIRAITGAVEAMLTGWDHEALLGALFTPLTGLGATPEGDRLEFELRAGLPGRGLDALRRLAPALYEKLHRIDSWRGEERTPAEWADCAATLRTLIAPGPPIEPLTHETALVARSAAMALDAFDAAVEQAAELMDGDAPVSFADYWRMMRAALRLADLRVIDRRRDVVHVIDVYEARQWELPVVFVCGLLEKEFPLYHAQELLFDDAARSRLAAAGVRVRTSEERQREERFLFDIATSRATSELALTWPRYNEKGDENLRSFYLDEFAKRPGVFHEKALPVRPEPRGAARVPAPAPIRDEALLASLGRKHAVLAPTAIESFLQCPFQFFARRSLVLEPPPRLPEDRLDTLLLGQILHAVLAELVRNPQPELPLLANVFHDYCDQERVPEGYRRVAALLELERHLKAFLAEPVFPMNWTTEVERPFELALDGLTIRGRIDRVEVDPRSGRAIVIDYKYSSAQAIRDNVKAHEEGRLVQGGLYMLALQKLFRLKPAAMVYCGIRQDASMQGWRCGVPELPATVMDCQPDVLQGIIDQALERSLDAAAKIRAGQLSVAPADADKCRFCEFADICRVETALARIAAGEGAE